MKLVRRIRRNVDCIARSYNRLCTTERSLQFTFQQDKSLFEIVAMGWRAAPRRNMHIDETKASCGGIARQKQGVGISHDADVSQALVIVWLGKRQSAIEIVKRNR